MADRQDSALPRRRLGRSPLLRRFDPLRPISLEIGTAVALLSRQLLIMVFLHEVFHRETRRNRIVLGFPADKLAPSPHQDAAVAILVSFAINSSLDTEMISGYGSPG
jgi:hypothetical protein